MCVYDDEEAWEAPGSSSLSNRAWPNNSMVTASKRAPAPNAIMPALTFSDGKHVIPTIAPDGKLAADNRPQNKAHKTGCALCKSKSTCSSTTSASPIVFKQLLLLLWTVVDPLF